jgi:hypothetical protein
MQDEIMYNLWKGKSWTQKYCSGLKKKLCLNLKTYFDKDSVTQVYDSVEIKAGGDGFIHLSKQKSEGKVAEAATHQENFASHESYLPCQSVMISCLPGFEHSCTKPNLRVKCGIKWHHAYIPTFFGYLISVALQANFELSNAVASEIQQKYIYGLVTYLWLNFSSPHCFCSLLFHELCCPALLSEPTSVKHFFKLMTTYNCSNDL